MSSRLAERLNGARHSRFVGRTDEQALFRSVLAATELPFFVLYVFGPGGVGKTALLNEFSYLCEQARAPVIFIDGRNVDPSPECFINALQTALNVTPPTLPLPVLAARPERQVIIIDTYEVLAPLDNWLRTTFLPQLPENVLMVLASSNPPPPAWRTDPGWQAFIHFLPLRNLTPTEGQVYLTNRDIPARQQAAILDFTHGHPLALALVADMFAQRHDIQFQPEIAPNMIQTLLERLVQKVPGPAHRTALEACAMVRVMTEALLAEMLAMPDPHELFTWLRSLSFMEPCPEGLFPHDLVRETLAADLRWRNPDWYAELHRRARAYYTYQMQQTAGQAQQRVILDYIFLHRDNPAVKPFFEWQVSGNVLTDTLRQADLPYLKDMVATYEGEASAELAAHWFKFQPDHMLVFRNAQGQPAGFMLMVALHQASPDQIKADPAAQAAWHYLQQHAPLRSGEGAILFRFWMAQSVYQAVSPIQSLVFVNAVQHYLTTPGLAFTFFPCADPDFWAAVFTYAGLTRLPEADFEVGGRRFGVYGHDWRVVPPATWLALLAEREVAPVSPTIHAPAASELLVVLSRPDFEQAVRHALRDFTQPDLLRANPLVKSRLVADHMDAHTTVAERVAALQALLEKTIERLQPLPRQVKCYRALYHTYLLPASTQEAAAELLGVPFSTFRRHLTSGIAHVVETLWQQELGGAK